MLDRYILQKGNYHPKSDVLVKWKGAPVEDATWKMSDACHEPILIFFVDKEIQGGRIDMNI